MQKWQTPLQSKYIQPFLKHERMQIMQEQKKQVTTASTTNSKHTAKNANVGFKNQAQIILDQWKLIDKAMRLELDAEVQLEKE